MKEREWGSATEVLGILEEVNGREINKKYLGFLVKQDRLKREPFDKRTFQYWLPGAWDVVIPQKKDAGNKRTHPEGKRKKEA